MAKLILRVPGEPDSEISLEEKDSVTIGRSPECDMPITDGQASRQHASVARSGDGFEVSDLGSTNGTLLNDIQVKQRMLQHGDIIKIGATEITYDDPNAIVIADHGDGVCCLVYAKGGRKGQKIELSAQRTTVGRKESNTIVLDDGVASSYHAEVVRDLNGYTLRDLGSTNGTLVNNEMVTEAMLVHGARLRIGNTRFVFQDPAMAEVDLELAGVDDDEVEWGMMRDLDLASVRRRNPATYVYLVLFLGICGALYWLTQVAPTRVETVARGPKNNLVSDYGFERRTSALRWDGDDSGSVEVRHSNGTLVFSASEDGGTAVYGETIQARGLAYKLTGRCSGAGRLGLRFSGAGISQWVLPNTGELGTAGSSVDLLASAPPWAYRVEVGVLFDGAGTTTLDDVGLVRVGPARIDTIEQGSFQLQTVDGRQLELLCRGAPTLAKGRLVAFDGNGNEIPASNLAVSAKTDGELGFIVQITGGGDAAMLGVEFTEVGGYLTQEGWRAFTPGQDPEFHAAFPDGASTRLSGVRKMLVGGRGRAISCVPADDASRLDTIAANAHSATGAAEVKWTILARRGDGGASFKIRTNLRGEGLLAQDAVTQAGKLYNEKRWGEFLDAASSALAEFPFIDASVKRRLLEKMTIVISERAVLRRDALRELADYDDFKDMQSLDRVLEKLSALAGRHQVKSGVGQLGEAYQEIAKAEQSRRESAEKAQQTKKADPVIALAFLSSSSDEWNSAAVMLWEIVNRLPSATQVDEARSELETIGKKHPKVLKVLRRVLEGK